MSYCCADAAQQAAFTQAVMNNARGNPIGKSSEMGFVTQQHAATHQTLRGARCKELQKLNEFRS
jgi:hypothetical protein